jgi:hypothetical protein
LLVIFGEGEEGIFFMIVSSVEDRVAGDGGGEGWFKVLIGRSSEVAVDETVSVGPPSFVETIVAPQIIQR